MIIYFDTEFTTLDGNIDWDMISAGFVAEDGQSFYLEISDFDRATCSDFVVETVLPLLEGKPEQTVAGREFGARLAGWLRTFEQEITLVSDAACDQTLIEIYAGEELRKLAHAVGFRIWKPSALPGIQQALDETEQRFLEANPGQRHHAFVDARRLALLAQLQERQIREG